MHMISPKFCLFILESTELMMNQNLTKNAPYDLSGAITHVRQHDFWDNNVFPDPWDVVLYDEILKQSQRGGVEGLVFWLPAYRC
jgi:hypothetical protein